LEREEIEPKLFATVRTSIARPTFGNSDYFACWKRKPALSTIFHEFISTLDTFTGNNASYQW